MRDIRILLLLSLLIGACTAAVLAPQDAAEATAEHFLSSIDQADYEASWIDTSAVLRENVSRNDWVAHLRSTRDSLGPVSHRESVSVEFLDSLEDAPDGEYAILTYASSFADKREAMEVVALSLEATSTWKVVGYYIH